jgi:amidase
MTHLDDLIVLASKVKFRLSLDDAPIYAEAIAELESAMATFSDVGEDRPRLRSTERRVLSRSKEDDPYNCFITRCLVKGVGRGPLAGKRVGLKDNISVAGIPMTLGSKFMEGFVPDMDATVVTRLLDAGADIVGKLSMDDFCRRGFGSGSGGDGYERCLNPRAPERLTGGSSSGSAAAVAAGAVDFSIGGDQGGSIRVPAAWCDVVGLKPTFGLIPHTGVVGIEPSVDHIGPIGPTVKDVAMALECLAGADGYDPRQANLSVSESYTKDIGEGVRGVRIGILREGFKDVEPDVEAVVREAITTLRKAGATVQEVSVPDHLECWRLYHPLGTIGHAMTMRMNGGPLLNAYHDTHLIHALGQFFEGRSDLLPPPMKLSLLIGESPQAPKYYAKVQNIRGRYRHAYDTVLQNVDCLAMPTVGFKPPLYVPPKDHEESLRRRLLRGALRGVGRNTTAFNITGHPAVSVPCALSDGLPVGLQVAGPHFSEGLLLRVANVVEQHYPARTARQERCAPYGVD